MLFSIHRKQETNGKKSGLYAVALIVIDIVLHLKRKRSGERERVTRVPLALKGSERVNGIVPTILRRFAIVDDKFQDRR